MIFQFLFIFLFLQIINSLVCPNGWTYFSDRCWMKSQNEMSWFDADSECRQRYGATLATIQNEKESFFMTKLRNSDDSKFKFFDQSESTFLNCFVKIKNSALLGSSVMSPSNIKTAEQCVEECAKAQERYDQICKSILWYKESKECVLNDKTRNDTDAVFIQDPELSENIDYYEKICEIESEKESEILIKEKSKFSNFPKKKKPGEISGIRSCFSKFKHSSLVGFVDRIHDNVTERQCLSKCWRCEECLTNEKEPCKSVIYFESVKQCILTKESRRTKPEYFDDSETLATFFERRRDCLFEICEDQELDLVFAIDGSAKMNWFGFEKSLKLVDSIVSAIHEITEFWKLTLVQVGTEGPAVIEIEKKSFDTLDDMRRVLATIGWRRSFGNRLGDSLVDVADLAMKIADEGETDFVWMITMTSGFSDDSLDDFLMLKKRNYFTSFAIGVGSDLDFVNLEKIATSDSYLIHSQESKMIVKNMTAKLCPKYSESFTETENVDLPEKKTTENNKTKIDQFVSKTDAYRINSRAFYDDRAKALTEKTDNRFKTSIRPSTIAFLGNSAGKNDAKLKKFLSNSKKLGKLTSDFVKSLRNDSIDFFKMEKFWIGFKRSELGPFEWSDGSKLDLFDGEKSKHLEIEKDSGNCIYWSSDLAWKQFDCFKKLEFVCNLRPMQTINEKLEHDFGNFHFDIQKQQFSEELLSFPSTVEPKLITPSSTTSASQLFDWGPNKKFTARMKTNPPSATPPNFENMSNEVDPNKLLQSDKMSNFLVPFGKKKQ